VREREGERELEMERERERERERKRKKVVSAESNNLILFPDLLMEFVTLCALVEKLLQKSQEFHSFFNQVFCLFTFEVAKDFKKNLTTRF
jgi:hypothetical protein